MPRGRHTAARFPPVVFVLLCVAVAPFLERSKALPVASVRRSPAIGAPAPAIAAATPLHDPSPGPSLHAGDPAPYRGLTAIGDSVMVDAMPNLEVALAGLTADAVAGRQVASGIAAMQTLATTGRLGDTVVIALGTNGPFSSGQMDRIVSLAGRRRLVMLTNHCANCAWVTANNNLIRSGCRQVPDCTVADWEDLASANPDWFYTDGVHMPIGGEGGRAYAALIARTLADTPPTRHLRNIPS